MPDRLLVEHQAAHLPPAPARPGTVGAVPGSTSLLARGADATADAGLGAGRVRQDHPAGSLAGGWRPAGPTAWVSLDERDRDPSSFWTYVLLAVDRAAPGTATGALAQLQSGQAPIEAVLTALLNELSVLPDDLTLVLDDYHLAEGPDIQPGMTFLLDHLPPQVHLVISTRADPALPLARLRARGELVEVRAADLRFTGDEAAAYLNDVNGLGLAPDDVAALEGRTEGWVAALQLAALSLQGRDDPVAVHRRLRRRRPVRRGLPRRRGARPAAAGRAPVPAGHLGPRPADRPAVRRGHRRTGGKAMLESLERQNLFLVPLDDHRRWYRYHHLFADVLRAHLLDERPDDVPELHRRASDWYDQAGDPEAAVRHALAAGDVDLAAERGRARRPGAASRAARGGDPPLGRRAARRRRERPAGARRRVHRALSRRATSSTASTAATSATSSGSWPGPPRTCVVVDQAELARLPAAVETYRAGAGAGRRRPGRHRGARRARPGPRRRGRPSHHRLGLRAASGSRPGPAGPRRRPPRLPRRRRRASSRAGHVADVLGCTITLADIELTQGRLGDAQRTCEHALDAGRARRPAAAGRGRHARRAEPRGPGTRRPRRRGRAPAPGRRARRAGRPAPEPLPVAGRDGAAARRPRATPRPRSTCSTRPSGSTSATSRPNVRPVAADPRPGARRRRRRWPRRWRGRAAGACPPTDEPVLPARVRARHPGAGPARRPRGLGSASVAGRRGCPARPAAGGRRGGRPARASSSRCWCCRRSRTRRPATAEPALDAARARAATGRARGLRPGVHRRGAADGRAARRAGRPSPATGRSCVSCSTQAADRRRPGRSTPSGRRGQQHRRRWSSR